MKTDYAGQKFGMLTFMSYDHSDGCSAWWLVKCDCGIEKLMRAENVTNPKNRSCGCHRKQQGKKHNAWHGVGELGNSVVTHIRLHAKRRGIEFKLTTEQLWNLFQEQGGRCALTGRQLTLPRSFRAGWHKDFDASLDRIDSSKAYEQGNIQWVYRKINMMKQQYQQDEFIELCKEVAVYQKELNK